MGVNDWIRQRTNVVPFGGTVGVPNDNDTFAVGIANEQIGGHHVYETLEGLAGCPKDRLLPGMKATVLTHIRPDDTKFNRETYCFDPTDEIWEPFLEDPTLVKISDIVDYDLSLFWKPDSGKAAQTANQDIQSQYADNQDYGRVGDPAQPAFQEPLISSENYQAGHKSNTDSSIIWSDTYDPTVHKWERQRLGDLGQWGIPRMINSDTYSEGDYTDTKFIWVDKGDVPTRPPSIFQGKPNNDPEGWINTPEVPGGGDYYEYIETHDLFKITAQKGVYGDLESEWSTPQLVSTDPNLVRYGNKPSSTDFIAEGGGDTADWRGYFTPGLDTHMATRIDSSSPWRIQKIDGEDGQYQEFIFKAFPLGYEPDDSDRPTINNPFSALAEDEPNAFWKSEPFVVGDTEILHRSVAWKYNNGELKPSGWSIPTRADGKDTIQVVVEPQGASYFKRDGAGVVTPTDIVLKAVLYRGNTPVAPDEPFRWYKGEVDEDNEIIKDSVIGPSQYHTISGEFNEILTINNVGVVNTQLYTAVGLLAGEDYIDPITVLDVTDGIGIIAVIEPEAGFTIKNGTGELTFKSRLYLNGIEVPITDYLVQWYLGGATFGDDQEVVVTGDDFTDQEVLKLEIIYQGQTYQTTEMLTDVNDAEEVLIQWSTQDPLPPSEGDQVWTDSAANAVYMRISNDGGATWQAWRVKGESADYNGGFQKSAYINSSTQPTASGLTSDLKPVGAGWTGNMTSPGPGQHVWEVTSFFEKNPATTDTTPTSANWNQVTSWSVAIRKTGIDGDAEGPPGDDGPVGWSPVFALVSNGPTVEVLKIVDWVNNDGADPGTKPATGQYITATGLSTDINAGKNVKGSTVDANSRPQYYVNTGNKRTTPPTTPFSSSSPVYRSGTFQVQNTWSQTRWFRIDAEFPYTNDGSGNDSIVAMLTSAPSAAGFTSNPAIDTRQDMNYSRQDYVADPTFPGVCKIRLSCTVQIAAGGQMWFRVGAVVTDGTACLIDNAFIEAYGL